MDHLGNLFGIFLSIFGLYSSLDGLAGLEDRSLLVQLISAVKVVLGTFLVYLGLMILKVIH